MKKGLLATAFVIFWSTAGLTQVSSSFEPGYFSRDKKFQKKDLAENEFLRFYAGFSSRWFMDSALNTRVIEPDQIRQFLLQLKDQPLPEHRRRFRLDDWRTTNYRAGDHERSISAITRWDTLPGISTNNGVLFFTRPQAIMILPVDSLQGPFRLSWRAMSISGKFPLVVTISGNQGVAAEAGFHANGNIFFTDSITDRMGEAYVPGRWYNFALEIDLEQNRYNLIVDNRVVAGRVRLKASSTVHTITVTGSSGTVLDDIRGVRFDTNGTRCIPVSGTFLSARFDIKPNMQNWPQPDYDDSLWEKVSLPAIRGGDPDAGQDIFLRTGIRPEPFEKAFLNLETLDPGGEVWINGKMVHVTLQPHPLQIDITPYLIPHRLNTIAIRVYANYTHSPVTLHDRNTGWFCGRVWLDLTNNIRIGHVQIHTVSLEKSALQLHRAIIHNEADTAFSGTLSIDYYPWHPVTGSNPSAHFSIPVRIPPKDTVHLVHTGRVDMPMTWTPENPNLYQVRLRLQDRQKFLDESVKTTGIRTIALDNNTCVLNGKPWVLKGASVQGYRMPPENMAEWYRYPPAEMLATELLTSAKLGNSLQIPVRDDGTTAFSIHDRRLTEMADQLGIMLLWPDEVARSVGQTNQSLQTGSLSCHPSVIGFEDSGRINWFTGQCPGMPNPEHAWGKSWPGLSGSIGNYAEGDILAAGTRQNWRVSQARQGFHAWESVKQQRIKGVNAFIWSGLQDGAGGTLCNVGLTDTDGHAKLAFYVYRMAVQTVLAGSIDSHLVFHRKDQISPVIFNMGDERLVKLKIVVRSAEGTITDTRLFNDILLEKSPSIKKITPFRPHFAEEGYYMIEYFVLTP